MPTTVGGLLIFAAFVTPGFLNYIQRRSIAPQRSLSPFVEISYLATVSTAANLVVAVLFCIVRLTLPTHSPNIRLLAVQGMKYVDPRIGYIFIWAIGFLAISCLIAFSVGRLPSALGRINQVIVDASAWYHLFELAPADSLTYVGCDLSDGSYVSGFLAWYNTDVDEIADRDLVLSAPIREKINGEESTLDFQWMILSARNINRLSVSFVSDNALAEEEGNG
jgi:hypothetical protein